MAKNFVKSKSFWLNAVAIGSELAGVLPSGTATIVTLGILNIITRLLTTEPVSVLPKSE